MSDDKKTEGNYLPTAVMRIPYQEAEDILKTRLQPDNSFVRYYLTSDNKVIGILSDEFDGFSVIEFKGYRS